MRKSTASFDPRDSPCLLTHPSKDENCVINYGIRLGRAVWVDHRFLFGRQIALLQIPRTDRDVIRRFFLLVRLAGWFCIYLSIATITFTFAIAILIVITRDVTVL